MDLSLDEIRLRLLARGDASESVLRACDIVQRGIPDAAAAAVLRDAWAALQADPAAAAEPLDTSSPSYIAAVEAVAGRIDTAVGGVSARSALAAKLRRLPLAQLDLLSAQIEAGTSGVLAVEPAVDALIRAAGAELSARIDAPVRPVDLSLGARGLVDLSALDGAAEPPTPPYVHGLVYAAGVGMIVGPAGCGKTWVALAACRDAARAGGRAMYIDLDNNGADPLLSRLLALGADRKALEHREIDVVNPAEIASADRATYPDSAAALRGVLRALEVTKPAVVVIDSFAQLMGTLQRDENAASDVSAAFSLLEVLRAESSVLLLDHTGHEDGGRARGSSAKSAAADSVIVMDPWATDDPDLMVAATVLSPKDRHAGMWSRLPAPGDTGKARRLGTLRITKPRKLVGLGPGGTTTTTSVRLDFTPAAATAAAKAAATAAAAAAGELPEQKRAAALREAVATAGDAGARLADLRDRLVALGATQREARAEVEQIVAEEVAAGTWEPCTGPKGVKLIRRCPTAEAPAETTAETPEEVLETVSV